MDLMLILFSSFTTSRSARQSGKAYVHVQLCTLPVDNLAQCLSTGEFRRLTLYRVSDTSVDP